MRWVKGLARQANAGTLEKAVMIMNRARYQPMKAKKRTLLARSSARKRAARDHEKNA